MQTPVLHTRRLVLRPFKTMMKWMHSNAGIVMQMIRMIIELLHKYRCYCDINVLLE